MTFWKLGESRRYVFTFILKRYFYFLCVYLCLEMVVVTPLHFMEDIVAIVFLRQCRLLATNYYYFSALTVRTQPVDSKYIGMARHKVKNII